MLLSNVSIVYQVWFWLNETDMYLMVTFFFFFQVNINNFVAFVCGDFVLLTSWSDTKENKF